MHLSRYLLPSTLAVALLLTACGNDAGTGAADTEAEAGAADTAADAETAADTDADAETPADVAVASTDLGDALVDAEGMTLYLFTPDEQGPSTCYDDCATNWPPLTTDGEPSAGEGADTALLGTTERDDGSQQVTYNDWPLYLWQGDQQPGDVTGQNVNEVWFVVSPAGDAVTANASETENSTGY